jgi:hypothetical protein
MPEPVAFHKEKGIGHAGSFADGHDGIPVAVPGVDQFKRRLDKIFGDLPLGDQVHDRQQEKRLVGRTMAGRFRPVMAVFIGVEAGKFFQVFIY